MTKWEVKKVWHTCGKLFDLRVCHTCRAGLWLGIEHCAESIGTVRRDILLQMNKQYPITK